MCIHIFILKKCDNRLNWFQIVKRSRISSWHGNCVHMFFSFWIYKKRRTNCARRERERYAILDQIFNCSNTFSPLDSSNKWRLIDLNFSTFITIFFSRLVYKNKMHGNYCENLFQRKGKFALFRCILLRGGNHYLLSTKLNVSHFCVSLCEKLLICNKY